MSNLLHTCTLTQVSNSVHVSACMLVLVQFIDNAIYRFINKRNTMRYSNCAYPYIVIQGQRSVIYVLVARAFFCFLLEVVSH